MRIVALAGGVPVVVIAALALATIIKPLTATPWGTKDFYVEDPDGYIVCFGGCPAAD